MKTLAVAVFCAVPSVALADYTVTFPQFSLSANDQQTFAFTLPTLPGEVVTGYDWQGNYDKLIDTAFTFGSDLKLTLTAPVGATDSKGGYTNVGTLGEWDFNGFVSNSDGFYFDNDLVEGGGAATLGTSAGGQWSATYKNDYGAATIMTWTGVKLTIHTETVPSAATMALATIAALGGLRRRRNCRIPEVSSARVSRPACLAVLLRCVSSAEH